MSNLINLKNDTSLDMARCNICVSIGEASKAELVEGANEGFRLGADIVELRLDHLREKLSTALLDEILSGITTSPTHILVTIRPAHCHGKYEGDEQTRKLVLEHAIDKGVGYIDIERKADFLPSIVHRAKGKTPSPRIIVSEHGTSLPDRTTMLSTVADELSKGGNIAKCAYPIATLDALSSMYNALDDVAKEYAGRYTIMGMGELGSSVRIMAPRYKMALVYACLPSRPLVEGQIAITKLKRIWAMLGLLQDV